MRIAVVSDIHGVLVAVEAVQDDLTSDEYDEVVCLGDVALRGPQPVECLERLRVDMRRVSVDLDALEWSAHASGMPHAQWWMSHRDRTLTTLTR